MVCTPKPGDAEFEGPEPTDRELQALRIERIAQIVDRAAERLAAAGWIDIDSFVTDEPDEIAGELRELLEVLVDVRNYSRLPLPGLRSRARHARRLRPGRASGDESEP